MKLYVLFIEKLLNKENLRECYFWISEIYFSGFSGKTRTLLWQIYYDFYARQYSDLEVQLTSILSKKTISAALKAVKLLFGATPDCMVYVLRLSEKPVGSLRGRPPAFLQDIDPKYKKLVLLRHKKRFDEMAFLMRSFTVEELIPVFAVNFKVNPEYENIFHQFLVAVMRDSSKLTSLGDEPVKKEDIQWIRGLNKPNSSIWRTLRDKRLYSISTTIGAFSLTRFDDRYPPMKRLLGFHWEYFSSFSPLWKKRFREYHAKRNREEFSMEFENDDYLEDFGELFNYEPDEQSAETQNKSILEIKKISGTGWLKNIFGCDVDLEDLGCYL